MTSDGYPTYAELPLVPGTDEHHAWEVWGRDDQLGAVNWVGPAEVLAGTRQAQEGHVVNLTAPLDGPSPGLFPERTPYRHEVSVTSHGRDDRLDGLYPQYSSQWDGLRHVRFRQHGYWGGRQDADVDGRFELGIEHWVRHGLVGRGVLLDAKGYVESSGGRMAPDETFAITPALLDEVAAAEGVTLAAGDFVLVRTGWMGWYSSLPDEERAALTGTVGRQPDPMQSPGLDAHQATAAWLWDHRAPAVIVDNVAVEVLPVNREVGFLHRRLIPLLGIALGEMWLLDELAEACRAAGRYTFLLSCAPLHIPGGVGSPANAYAVL